MNTKSRESDFFLFNVVPAKSGLKRDEPNMLIRVLCLAIILLAVIDIIVVIFFVKTNARIEAIRNDNFTEVVINNLEESEQKHHNFAEKAKEIIRNKNSYIKEFVDHMEFDARELDKLDIKRISLPTLPELKEALLNLEKDENIDLAKLKTATKLYSQVEFEMKNLNNYLMPVDQFNAYQDRIEKSLKIILDEIKGNLDNFLNQLNFLAKTQNEHQRELIEDMKFTLNRFSNVFGFVYKDGRYTKLNNYYEVEFIDFDKDYVPFSIEFENSHFGAQLTKQTAFNLRMPRIYYCTVQAYVYSDQTFSVVFQYIDKKAEAEGKNSVVFASQSIYGEFKKPISYNEIKVFSLETGDHELYLRVISEGSASQLHMKNLKMVCLSYRNFIDDKDANEENDEL